MKSAGKFSLSPGELRLFRSLSSPHKIQKFLDDLPYNKEPEGETCQSPRCVRSAAAHCFRSGVVCGRSSARSRQTAVDSGSGMVCDDDHVIAVYRERNCWGAIAKSNYSGLRFREPVYRSLRELAMSYFEHYFNLAGEKTLRAYSRHSFPLRSDSLDDQRRAAMADSRVSGDDLPHPHPRRSQADVYGPAAVRRRHCRPRVKQAPPRQPTC